ncbi:hypothetical protein [Dysgonomonas macrotermitis]|nr:hypothetical protein [Dysgonomonas macrotermitis]
MKKKILLLMGVFSLGITNAQVGINTQNPLGVFHIDPKGDTNASGTSGYTDDVIVTTDGDVGIGTITPTAKFHIKTLGTPTSPIPGFQLEDGNQGLNKALTSIDDSGLATWSTIVEKSAQTGKTLISANNKLLSELQGQYFLIGGGYISLPPGRWVVMLTFYMRTTNSNKGRYSINVTLTEKNLGNDYPMTDSDISTDIEEYLTARTSFFSHYGASGILSGSIIVNNTSNATKTYYGMLGDVSLIPTAAGNNRLYFAQMTEDVMSAFLIPNDN